MIFILRSKKGNIAFDVAIGVVILFAAGILITSFYLGVEAMNPLLKESLNGTATGQDLMNNQTTDYSNLWDYGLVFLFIGIWIAIIAASFLIDSNPLFYVIAIIVMIPALILSVYLSNAYVETATGDLSVMRTAFPMSYFIMEHMLAFSIAMVITMVIAIYGKLQYA